MHDDLHLDSEDQAALPTAAEPTFEHEWSVARLYQCAQLALGDFFPSLVARHHKLLLPLEKVRWRANHEHHGH